LRRSQRGVCMEDPLTSLMTDRSAMYWLALQPVKHAAGACPASGFPTPQALWHGPYNASLELTVRNPQIIVMDRPLTEIREPAVAGAFYPDTAEALTGEIAALLKRARAPVPGERCPKALIAPHAGYVYSGPIAANAYARLAAARGRITRVVLLGPVHRVAVDGLALPGTQGLRTPLGVVPVDMEAVRAIESLPQVVVSPEAHAREHSLEVQVPFLQILAGDLRFAAICVGTVDLASLEELGHALARAIQSSKEPVLIVASSDMNHFESAEVNKRKDDLAIEQVVTIDPEGLHRVVCEEDISMCGFAPAVGALVCCRDMGAKKGHLVRYAHSGEVTGDCNEVVSYAGMVIS